jgi:hypothetical protein
MNRNMVASNKWYCPDCKKILAQPVVRLDIGAFHALSCDTPMIRVDLLAAATQKEDDRG